MQGIEDQVTICCLGPETGSTLSADCPSADSSVAKSILEHLYYADRRTNWHLEISNGNIAIRTDRHPTFCYLTSIPSLGKGYTGKGPRSIKSIGRGMIEQLEAMGI